MKILVIDNNIDLDSIGARNLVLSTQVAPGATVQVRRGPDSDLPRDPSRFDRVIVSGSKTSCLEESPWIDELQSFIRKTLDAGVPYLGVCYGHQMLIRALGGKTLLRKAAKAEIGWTEITLTKPSLLTEGLPKKFYSFSQHEEEASGLPTGPNNPNKMTSFAHSLDCGIQACEMPGRPVFGIQFHPEKTLPEALKTIQDRKKEGAQNILFPNDSARLYNPEVGTRIFSNFLNLSTKP